MIGFAVGTPIQGLKLFFPYECIRNGIEMVVESADFYLFYQLLVNDSNIGKTKDMIYIG